MTFSDKYLKGRINCNRDVNSLFEEADKEIASLKSIIGDYREQVELLISKFESLKKLLIEKLIEEDKS